MRLSLFSRTAEIDPKWQSANCVVRVTRQGRREEHDFERTGYYWDLNAQQRFNRV